MPYSTFFFSFFFFSSFSSLLIFCSYTESFRQPLASPQLKKAVNCFPGSQKPMFYDALSFQENKNCRLLKEQNVQIEAGSSSSFRETLGFKWIFKLGFEQAKIRVQATLIDGFFFFFTIKNKLCSCSLTYKKFSKR